MLIVRCTDKIRDKHGNIIAYTIKDDSGNTKNVYANQLKEAIKSGKVRVENLKLTSDNRLINSNDTVISKNKQLNKAYNSINYYKSLGINIINKREFNNKLLYRDAYYNIIDLLNSEKSIGHAICLVGLRRTGKTVLLNQIKESCNKYNIKHDEILHLSLSAVDNTDNISRDSLDILRIDNSDNVKYPKISDIQNLISIIHSKRKIKLLIIDEITICEDLIQFGKGMFDWLFANDIKVLLAGTESASFILANENSLYTRLILVDTSYIPFGEYCRLKKLDTSTIESANQALEIYMKHGNILDDTINADTKYLEDAVGVNLALSIINSDNENFISYENNIKLLVESIVKYYKLLGESISLNAINDAISRADLFSKSDIKLNLEQLTTIDKLFEEMGLIYTLGNLPIENNPDYNRANDIYLIHSLLLNIGLALLSEIELDKYNLSITDIKDIQKSIKDTLYGVIIENIIDLQYIKQLELNTELKKKIVEYNGFDAYRKTTELYMYKYRKQVIDNNQPAIGEVDLVVCSDDLIKLIEIKKSSDIHSSQCRWLLNNEVISDIKKSVSDKLPIKKYVYYTGADNVVGTVEYKNIAQHLISEYNKYFNKSI